MPNLGNGEEIQEIGRLVRGYHDKVRQGKTNETYIPS